MTNANNRAGKRRPTLPQNIATRYRRTSFRILFTALRTTCLINKSLRTVLLFSPVFFAIPMFHSRKRVATCKLHCRP
jgi:hypothetical protein